MTANEFVEIVREIVIKLTAESTVTLMLRPEKKQPAELVEVGRWYSKLTEQERAVVGKLVAFVARGSVFGLFTALDGALKTDNSAGEGDYFELRYCHKDRPDDILSGPNGSVLHELL